MDDVTGKRLESEARELSRVTHAALGPAAERLNEAKTDVLTAEMAKIGVPADASGASHGLFLVGYVIGNMVSRGVCVEHCRRVLDAVGSVLPDHSYDVCVYDGTTVALHEVTVALGDTDDVMIDVYRWARLFRVAVAEIYFALEDYHDDPRAHSGEALLATALRAARFLVDTLHPAYSQAQA